MSDTGRSIGFTVGALLLLKMCAADGCSVLLRSCNPSSAGRVIPTNQFDEVIRPAAKNFNDLEILDIVKEVPEAAIGQLHEIEIPDEFLEIGSSKDALGLYELMKGEKLTEEAAILYGLKLGGRVKLPGSKFDSYTYIDLSKGYISTTQKSQVGLDIDNIMRLLKTEFKNNNVLIKGEVTPEVAIALRKNGIRFFTNFEFIAKNGLPETRTFQPVIVKDGSLNNFGDNVFKEIKNAVIADNAETLKKYLNYYDRGNYYPLVIFDNQGDELFGETLGNFQMQNGFVISCNSYEIKNINSYIQSTDYIQIPELIKALHSSQSTGKSVSASKYFTDFSIEYEKALKQRKNKQVLVSCGIVASGAGVVRLAIYLADDENA